MAVPFDWNLPISLNPKIIINILLTSFPPLVRAILLCGKGKPFLTQIYHFLWFSLLGSRGSRHSTDSGTTSDSGDTRDTVFEDLSSPFRSDLETSPPMSPSSPPSFQKGAYISKVIFFFCFAVASPLYLKIGLQTCDAFCIFRASMGFV